MSMLDNVKDKAMDMMNDPENRDKIQQLAKDKGISLDEAKQHFMKKDGQSE